ncbi:MAG TPA: hypothetical protein VF070_40835 [Streptosporangiaceae bacterium]
MSGVDTADAGSGGFGSGGGPEAALAELGRAISRASDALAAIPDGDDVTAYKCARVLDAAFGDLTELLGAVPRIVGLGDPGRVVGGRLEQRRAELATRRDELAAYRGKLDDLAETGLDLAELTEEIDKLRGRVSDLERSRQLASELPGLRIQVDSLEEAVAAVGAADGPDIGARIAEAADRFAALTERQRKAIGEDADKLVAAAATAAAELDEQRARLEAAAADVASREREAAHMKAAYGETLPILTAWSQADTDLADGLRTAGIEVGGSVLETVVTELDSIRQRLVALDNSLRPLLADHAKAYEDARKVRPW